MCIDTHFWWHHKQLVNVILCLQFGLSNQKVKGNLPHNFFIFCTNSCAKPEKAHKYNVYCGEARHGKAFEGLLKRYFG